MAKQAGGFNPQEHMIRLKGKDYLQVAPRLVWLREEHPEASIETECTYADEQSGTYRFKATVRLEVTGKDGATRTVVGVGHGMATRKEFPSGPAEKAECLELGAHILTRHGFRAFNQLSVGEDVLAYDPAQDRCIWTPLLAVTVHDDRPVVRMSGRWFDVTMTPEHSWATLGTWRSVVTGAPPRRLRKGTELTPSDRIILAAPGPSGTSPITPDEAAVLGWVFTDGTIKYCNGNVSSAAITQSKARTVPVVRELVGAVAHEMVGKPTIRTFPSGTTYNCLPQHVFRLPARETQALFAKAGITTSEDLPAFVSTLTQPARAAMLGAMMAADGDQKGHFGKIRKPGVAEAWQILCTLEGIAVGRRRNEAVFPVQRMKKRRTVCVSELDVTDAGRCPVWCPTTAYGTWVTRLPNGQVTITGNTKAIGRSLAFLGYGTMNAQELEDDDNAIMADAPVGPPQGNPPRGGLAVMREPVDVEALRAQVEAALAQDAEAAAKLPKSASEMNEAELSKTANWLQRRARALSS